MTTPTTTVYGIVPEHLQRMYVDLFGQPDGQLAERLHARLYADGPGGDGSSLSEYDSFSNGLTNAAGALVEPYQPYTDAEHGGDLDLRPSEIEWLDGMQEEMCEAAESAAVQAMLRVMFDRLPEVPKTILQHPANEQLRADLALLYPNGMPVDEPA